MLGGDMRDLGISDSFRTFGRPETTADWAAWRTDRREGRSGTEVMRREDFSDRYLVFRRPETTSDWADWRKRTFPDR
jgi:hypothetical protein